MSDTHKAHLLKLPPTNDDSKNTCCDLGTYALTVLPPFIAIKNARGYYKVQEPIEVNGQVAAHLDSPGTVPLIPSHKDR